MATTSGCANRQGHTQRTKSIWRKPMSSNRRTFVKQSAFLLAGLHASPWLRYASADTGNVVAATASGQVRGVATDGVNVFKGIPYGASTAGKNRFMPPVKPAPWTDIRDALA